jgi:hypothetical protein
VERRRVWSGRGSGGNAAEKRIAYTYRLADSGTYTIAIAIMLMIMAQR